jgi:uncharacterized alpha-E superfamily protein
MGRHLERAEHLCRLLRLQAQALVDRPAQEIHLGWERIYDSMYLQPPGGSLGPVDNDDFTLADSYTLADHLTFDRSNSVSVWSSFALGRENARQMRHCISEEMWTSLNLAYLRFRNLEIQDIWVASPESFYADVVAEIDTFVGVAASSMYRDERYHFMQLGRFIERAQLSSSLFLTQLAADRVNMEYAEEDWTTLLRLYHALQAYSSRYTIEVRPSQALDLLATDPQLPDSLCRSVDMAAAELGSIAPGPDSRSNGMAQRLAGRLAALVHYEWPDRDDREELLQQVSEDCRRLHGFVTAAYFEYQVEDTPVH